MLTVSTEQTDERQTKAQINIQMSMGTRKLFATFSPVLHDAPSIFSSTYDHIYSDYLGFVTNLLLVSFVDSILSIW